MPKITAEYRDAQSDEMRYLIGMIVKIEPWKYVSRQPNTDAPHLNHGNEIYNRKTKKLRSSAAQTWAKHQYPWQYVGREHACQVRQKYRPFIINLGII